MNRSDSTRRQQAEKDAAEKAKRRERERQCAVDFLLNGDADGRHAKRCIHSIPCSRDYNPRPYPEAMADPKLYEGTGIGLLYGLSGPSEFWIDLAGWNLNPVRERMIGQELHDAPSIGKGDDEC